MRWVRRGVLLLALFGSGPLLVVSCGSVQMGQDWRTADRSSTGIAPEPKDVAEAIVQVYAARAFNWRGIFAVHTWIATKPANARNFTVHQVVGWRRFRNLPVVASQADKPDRAWFNSPPVILRDLRGPQAEAAIPLVEAAVRSYPYAEEYGLWPGPNSNTFTAYVARRVPMLRLDLPTTAIGKDFLEGGKVIGRAPSATGYQLSLYGLFGLLLAKEEGLEINLLGLTFGVDPARIAIKLPGVGRIGVR